MSSESSPLLSKPIGSAGKKSLHVDSLSSSNIIVEASRASESSEIQNADDEYLMGTCGQMCLQPPSGMKVKISNPPLTTILLLLNSMIGSGILVQPYVFKETGIIATIIEYLVIGYMTFLGVDLLIRAAERADVFDYSRLASKALGEEFGGCVLDFSITINNAGALLSYILIINTLISSVILTYVEDTSPIYLNSTFLTGAIVTLFVLPNCLIRNFGHLAIASIVSITAITGTVLLVVIGGPMLGSSNSSDALNYANFDGSIMTIGSIVFAFGYTSAIFLAYDSLEPRNVNTFSEVAMWSTLSGISMCFVTGLIGYLSFRDDTQTDILENFTGILGSIFKIAVIAHLIFYIPSDYIVMRESLCNLIGIPVNKMDDAMYILFTIITLGAITATACLLLIYNTDTDSLSIVLDLTGGFAGSLTTFIIPGLIGTFILKEDLGLYYWSLGLVVFGCSIPVFVVTSIILQYS